MLCLFEHNSFGLVDPFETGAEPVNALDRPCVTNTADRLCLGQMDFIDCVIFADLSADGFSTRSHRSWGYSTAAASY